AERGRVRLDNATEVSISLLPTVFAAAVFGPLAAMIVAACSMIGDFPALSGGGPYLKWGIWTCVRAIYGAAAGFAAAAVAPLGQTEATTLILATAVAAIVAECMDVAFGALTLWLRGGDAVRFVRMFLPILVVAVSLYAPIVALLALAYEEVSPWTLA